jgi:AraC-like DNA-binding protein
VAAYVQACAENSKELSFPRGRAAPVRKAIEYLHDHFDQPYSLADLARASGCGRFYLAHLFKEQVGVSPSVFKNRILVAKTCQALVASPLKPLEMIAWEVGWASRPTGFADAAKASLVIRHFQRTLKVTPGQFRSSLRQMSPSERRDYVANVETTSFIRE